MFVAYHVVLIARTLSPMDKGCFGMVSGRKLACTGAAKASSGTSGLGSHAVAWLVHPLARRGVGFHAIA